MVRMGSMQVGTQAEQLLDEYSRKFEAAGYAVRRGEISARGRFLAYRDPVDGFLRTVTVLPTNEGSMVLASVSDPSRMSRSETPTAPPPGWPVPPMATQPGWMESTSGARQQRTWLMLASCQSPLEIVEFYRQALPAAGWKAEPAGRRSSPETQEETWGRGEERCVVSVARRAEDCAVSVMCLSRRNP
jgi:hypothetical protein